MKRAVLTVLPVLAATLFLSACGGDETSTTPERTGAGATSSADEPATTPTPASVVNEQVREACQAAVTTEAPGASFSAPGTLRSSSSADGKLFTLSGTVQVGGVDTPYTCSAIAADTVTVDEVTVG